MIRVKLWNGFVDVHLYLDRRVQILSSVIQKDRRADEVEPIFRRRQHVVKLHVLTFMIKHSKVVAYHVLIIVSQLHNAYACR